MVSALKFWAAYLKVPAIVFLLLFGILAGPDCLGLLHPNLLGSGLEVMVSLSVALILFEGGLNLELRDLGKVSGSIRNLVTFGTLITLIGGGMAAHWLGEFPWPIAFLYASLVVVTGPTVIGPLLKQVSVDKQVAALLEAEGVLIDPVGAILAVLVLNIILNGNADLLVLFRDLIVRLLVGAVVGVCRRLAAGIHSQAIAISLRRLEKPSSFSRFVGIVRLIRRTPQRIRTDGNSPLRHRPQIGCCAGRKAAEEVQRSTHSPRHFRAVRAAGSRFIPR